MRDFVRLQIDKVLPGAHLELCGGYRRGKATSGDIDVLVTFPHQDGLERGVLRRLVARLVKKGLVPRDGGVLSLTEAGSTRTTWHNKRASLGDTLDKALVVFRHPANGTTRMRDVWRRVDLVVAAWPHWGPAVLGWTGSTQFERDLRRHANKLCVPLAPPSLFVFLLVLLSRSARREYVRLSCSSLTRSIPPTLPPPPPCSGYTFDSGGIRSKDTNEPVEAKTERDCFRLLKLEWIPCVLAPPRLGGIILSVRETDSSCLRSQAAPAQRRPLRRRTAVRPAQERHLAPPRPSSQPLSRPFSLCRFCPMRACCLSCIRTCYCSIEAAAESESAALEPTRRRRPAEEGSLPPPRSLAR